MVAGCTKLAKSEYLTTQNQGLMGLELAWEKQQELVGQEATWYEQRYGRGIVLENNKVKLVWDFEFHLQKITTTKKTDLILELKIDKKIWICDMACPQQKNIGAKRTEQLRDIRGSYRSWCIGWWYKSAKCRFEEDFQQ